MNSSASSPHASSELKNAVSPRSLLSEGIYVQFGCGTCAPREWRNFDAGPAFWIQRKLPFLANQLVNRGFPKYPRNIEYGDVVRGLPIDPGSALGVYCSHVLEHLTLEELRTALTNVYRCLAPGGIFRMVLPDLAYLIQSYLEDPDTEACSKFMEASLLGEKTPKRGPAALPRALFGRSRHLWMWDYKGLSQELKSAGFLDIRRARFGDSSDERFREIEDRGRWENCLGIECRR